jgi:hypothetical protein
MLLRLQSNLAYDGLHSDHKYQDLVRQMVCHLRRPVVKSRHIMKATTQPDRLRKFKKAGYRRAARPG